MSDLQPMTEDNVMPNVVGDSLATAENAIKAHATSDVTFNVTGDGTTVESTTPTSGQPITAQVTIVVYNPGK